MATTDHTQQYSAADIQRYLDGNMSVADMHALEKAALDDPFLADAIEGLQQTREQHDASLITANLQDISRRVYERTKKEDPKARVIVFRWWQVAAAAMVLVIAGIGIYRYSGSSKEAPLSDKQIALITPPPPTKNAEGVIPPAATEEYKANATTVTAENVHADSAAMAAVSPEKGSRKKGKKVSDKSLFVSDSIGSMKFEVSSDLNSSYSYSPSQANSRPLHLSERTSGDLIKFDSADLPGHNRSTLSKNVPAVVVGYGTKKATQPLTAAKQQAEYEQIVIPKTKRDSLAKDYYTKPRGDLAMNPSNKELSELSDRQLKRELKKNPNALLSGFIKGRVADQNNNPLYNAVVRVGDQQDFLTDKQGFFKIPASDSMVKVAVGYNGFYTQNLRLQNNTDNNITLNQLGIKPPNPQLNTVVKADTVTFNSNAFAKAKSFTTFGEGYRDNDANITAQNAQPEYGWLEYHQYLDKNKKLPSDSDDAIGGKVVVSFQVNKKGMLSDFKIEQSLRKDYDEEAIRLIKAGPSWKLTKGHRARATVVVNF
jgi:hypothetical protein